jgi:hypothetical protein
MYDIRTDCCYTWHEGSHNSPQLLLQFQPRISVSRWLTLASGTRASAHTHTRTGRRTEAHVLLYRRKIGLPSVPIAGAVLYFTLSPYVPSCHVLTWQQASCLLVRRKLEGRYWDDVAWTHLAQDRASCEQAIQSHVTLTRGELLAVCRARSSLALRVFVNPRGTQGRKSKSLGPFSGKERQSC